MNTLEASIAATPKYKAWRVTCKGFDASIIGSMSASKAKYQTLTQIREAGFEATFANLTAKRAPEYDQWANSPGITRNRAFDEDYVKGAAQPMKANP